MVQKVKVKQLVSYSKHLVKDNGLVNLFLKSKYSQLTKTVLCLQMLNNDVNIEAKIKDKFYPLGTFRIKKAIIDGDGESKLTFSSNNEYSELGNLNKVAIESQETPEFYVMMSANVDDEGNPQEEGKEEKKKKSKKEEE